MVLRGFRFGMLLQFAIGPLSLMVFNISSAYGVLMGLWLVLAIALVDGLFILLAGLGVATIINKDKVKFLVSVIGCIVMVLFGLETIAGTWNYSVLPAISVFSDVNGYSIFVQGIILTASSPLTIIFWGGVFTAQIVEKKLTRFQLVPFGVGCVLSTLVFQAFVAILGNIASGFLPPPVIQILNIAVGIVLIYFGIQLVYKVLGDRE